MHLMLLVVVLATAIQIRKDEVIRKDEGHGRAAGFGLFRIVLGSHIRQHVQHATPDGNSRRNDSPKKQQHRWNKRWVNSLDTRHSFRAVESGC
jgi:hypothetical protein